ncbi:redox-sensitive bicupin YhaK (pirin superfamily) [Microbacteriaceae bacterium SG_E_30_P1]|uniref:Redox-sensitive bicupin YhaK (Pirin superfamily) n=1 Tax=Antiquaquibacter oligotrophicus TaxID=2880260 RepID=A0ABT6KIS3_9MICO|nr:pirin family protein [Antiquaquibacter oligotrophicus]MDH6179838.1 redox-sensitive bicupin YhaK (pirin superfamily) [Antiquaquibacter oligotrophicus]UDF14401.1 pirin family protein [Antiquaquibacter oligotrophicus]
MSNLEKDPAEVLIEERPDDEVADPTGTVEILDPRDVPLGGARAMAVRRTLPQRARSLIGGWCFVDHYGPEAVTMDVPPHPHTGLQTVSWLFAGEIEHRDTVGSHAIINPGELNLMTAGRGIAHSEVSVPTGTPIPRVLHGAQLWIALPDAARHREPFFENYVPEPFLLGAATVRVFIGSLAGVTSSATVFSPLVGAQLDLPAGASVAVPVQAAHEHGVLVDLGDVTVDGTRVPVSHLGYVHPGIESLTIEAATDARILLIGGEPLGEQIVMWWNFIGRDHDEIVGFRDEWQAGLAQTPGRFGVLNGYDGSPLPAPPLPPIRLKPRG